MFALILFLLFSFSTAMAQSVVTVNLGENVTAIKDLSGVNRGPMSTHVLGYEEAGITTIRMQGYYGANDYVWYTDFWNFDESSQSFTTINTQFDPNNPDDYNWTDFDGKVNYIIGHGYEPYVRLGISYPRPPYVIQPNAPPLDPDGIHFTKFAQMAKRTVMHYNDGWDNGYHYNIKYWEIWNEPDGVFWSGTPKQFYRFFQTVAETLRAYNPNLILGGPAVTPRTTIGVSTVYLDQFLDYLQTHNVPLDFYSWHLYEIRNPYMLGVFAQNIRQKLDDRGFTSTESHVTEINHELGTETYLDDRAKGAAFYASLLIAAQKSPVDRLFWFPGDGFFFDDSAGHGHLKWGAYPLEYFSEMRRETPVQVKTEGDVVINGFWDVDTTNFMTLAACSKNGQKLSVLISNYNSSIDSYTVRLVNHPWKTGDFLQVEEKISRTPNDTFTTFQHRVLVNGPVLQLHFADMAAPSVLYLKIQKLSQTGVHEVPIISPRTIELEPNYPNPFNSSTAISYSLPLGSHFVQVDVYNCEGQLVRHLFQGKQLSGKHKLVLNGNSLASGTYLVRLKVDSQFQKVQKILLMK